LINKVVAFERQLLGGDVTEALDKLEKDIRKHVIEWVRDSYAISSPLALDKARLLELIGYTERLLEQQ
jgi:hypothetical protein